MKFDLNIPSRTTEDTIAVMIAQAINEHGGDESLASITWVSKPEFSEPSG